MSQHELATRQPATTMLPATASPQSMSGGLSQIERTAAVAPFYGMEYMTGIAQLAKAAVASKLYGELNEGQATMILQTGLEMGISPTVALRNIGSFKGKTTIASALMLAMVKAAGYQEEIVENTAERATVTIQKPGRKAYTVTFTIEDAKKAGLLERNALYRTNPATMILNRAIGLVCRYGAPEVGAGLYTPEEAMDITDDPGGSSSQGMPKAIDGWGIEELDEMEELLEKLSEILRAAGHAAQAESTETRWRQRKAKEPADVVLPELRVAIAKLQTPNPKPTLETKAPSTAATPAAAVDAEKQAAEATTWTEAEVKEAFGILALIKETFETLGAAAAWPAFEVKRQAEMKAGDPETIIPKLRITLSQCQAKVDALPKPKPEPDPIIPEVLNPLSGPTPDTPGEDFSLTPGSEEVPDPTAHIPANELNTVMVQNWNRISEILKAKGNKPSAISQAKTTLMSRWTVGVDPSEQESFERAIVRGQLAWFEDKE